MTAEHTPPPPSNNGWGEWKNMVLQELQHHHDLLSEVRLEQASTRREFVEMRVLLAGLATLQRSQDSAQHRAEDQDHRLQRIDTDIAALKVKASLWGALAGGVVGLLPILLHFFFKNL